MAKTPPPPLTTEVYITGCNDTLLAIFDSQYARLEAGEARAALESLYGRVWNEAEFNADFDVDVVSPPYISVTRRDNGDHGTVMRLDAPRFYFLFNSETTNAEG